MKIYGFYYKSMIIYLLFLFIGAERSSSQIAKIEENLIPFGRIGDIMEINSTRWLEVADLINPGIFWEFQHRENAHPQVPWFGEFPGKLLTSIAYSYRMSKDPKLLIAGNRVVDEFEQTQGKDGYLGSFKYDDRFSGILGSGKWKNWDLWNHYHNILGLYSWYKQTGNTKSMKVATDAANYIVTVFANRKYSSAEETQMNLAISHALLLLYNDTAILKFVNTVQRQKYYEDAKRIVDEEWSLATAGDWYNAALNNVDFYKTSMHRWEVLHCVMTLAELYKADKKKNLNYYKAFQQIYWSIIKTDIHNNGSFSTGEGACGNPYIAGLEPGFRGSIETCCTIAWSELSANYLALSHDSYVADELELTTLNGALGTLQVTANQALYTYDTPMNGMKEPAIKTLNWQSIKGAPDVSCCQMNGPKVPGLIGLWGLMNTTDAVYLNYYGKSAISTRTPKGNQLTLIQNTDYPVSGKISLEVSLNQPERLKLNLRIPFWSKNTRITLNGKGLSKISARSYYQIEREFNDGDKIVISFEMSPHYWGGEDRFTGFASIYWGPILLAHDEEVSGVKPDLNEEFDLKSIQQIVAKAPGKNKVLLEAAVNRKSGEKVILCDFSSVGQTSGKTYNSWFKVSGVPVVKFEKGATPVWGVTIDK
ncbi:MAG: beta-L-arabinofuranosidase domain-containing protein [Sphingobacteriaceae bacterium]